MKKILTPLIACCLLIGASGTSFADAIEGKSLLNKPQALQSESHDAKNNIQVVTNKLLDDNLIAMKKLWDDNLKYTHDYIVSVIEGVGDKKDVIVKKLTKTQHKIGDMLKPYYGDAASAKFSKLLNENVAITKEVVDAAKTKNNELLDSAQKKWDENAEAIANYLSSLNSYWSKTDLTDMLYKYVEATKNEATAIANKNQKDAVSYYDKSRMYISKFANTLAEGIEKQFPDKVKKQ